MSCPDGEVFVQRRDGREECLQLSCPEGFSLKGGKCLPDTSYKTSSCGTDKSNNTIILKAKLVTSFESCADKSKNVSEEFLSHLFGNSFPFEHVLTEKSTMCNEASKTLDLTYTTSSSNSIFEIIHDTLHGNSILYIPRISSDVREIEITQSCLNSNVEYTCDSNWWSVGEYIIKSQNGSQLVFLNSTAEWLSTDELIYRVRYQNPNATSGYTKNTQIKICHSNNYLPCPFLTMNRSLFEGLESTNGMLRYMPDGRTFDSSEYKISQDGQILVCNFLNQSAVINVTEIVTFFEYSNVQTIISLIGSVLSLVAAILTFLTYAVFASLRNRASRLIMNLIVALFLGQFLLLFGGNRTQNEDACFTVAVLAHYAWLAAFAWMNALAFDLDRTFGNPDKLQKMSDGKKSMFLYMIYAWGSPLLIVMPCIAVHLCQCTTISFHYGSSSACWISDGTANLLTFGVPAAIFLLFNVMLFGHTVAGIRATKKATARIQQEMSTFKRTTKELIIYIKIASLMGFTWIFGYIAAFTGVEALWYIYIILNSLQGLFIFISFICNRRVGLLWSKKLKLSGLIATTPKTSTTSGGTRYRCSSTPGTNMTGYSTSNQHDGSAQPLQGEVNV